MSWNWIVDDEEKEVLNDSRKIFVSIALKILVGKYKYAMEW